MEDEQSEAAEAAAAAARVVGISDVTRVGLASVSRSVGANNDELSRAGRAGRADIRGGQTPSGSVRTESVSAEFSTTASYSSRGCAFM